jgi:hypothetical protein
MPIFRRIKALLLHLVYIGLVLLDVVGSGCGALSCRMWALWRFLHVETEVNNKRLIFTSCWFFSLHTTKNLIRNSFFVHNVIHVCKIILIGVCCASVHWVCTKITSNSKECFPHCEKIFAWLLTEFCNCFSLPRKVNDRFPSCSPKIFAQI